MNDRPTPENDRLTARMNGSDDATHLIELDILSCNLERQLAEARDSLRATQGAWVRAKAERAEAIRERDEAIETLDRITNLRWEADMRAIKRWQAAHPGRELVWPDHADMVVWLLEQLPDQSTPNQTTP